MRVRHCTTWLAVAMLALLAAACGDEAAPAGSTPPITVEPAPTGTPGATPAATPEPTPTEQADARMPHTVEHGTAWGIAGLVPPNFDDVTDDDWGALYRALPELGGWAGTFASWSPAGGMPDIMRSQEIPARVFEFRTIPSVDFIPQDNAASGAVDFNDPDAVDAYTEALVELVRDVRPQFLGVGNEVNLVWEQDPDAFDAFVAALPSIVEPVREESPGTRLFTSFQLEFLRGGGAISGVEREPRWDLVDAVAEAVDFIGFTTYPWFDYASPDDIPDDYYRSVLDRVDAPVGFTEVAWPAGEAAEAPAGLGAGTPEQQAAFIERLEHLLDGVEPELVLWVHAFDTPGAGELFDSLGLHETDGTPRPAREAWEGLIEAMS